MTHPDQTLDALRREIDAIDREMHGLIMRRAGLVPKIAAAKGRSDQLNFVPAREAQLLRELLSRHEGAFPSVALVRIWREMVSAFAAMQGSFQVVVHDSGGACWDLARDHFGTHSPMAAVGSARDVVAQVSDGRAAVGVLPVPTDDAPGDGDRGGDWWTMLRGGSSPRVVLRLPFLAGGNARGGSAEALAIVRAAPAATGDDRSLLVVEGEEAVSRAALVSLFKDCGLDGHTMAVHGGEGWFCLADVAGFVEQSDPRLIQVAEDRRIARLAVVGAYASPIRSGVAGRIARPANRELAV